MSAAISLEGLTRSFGPLTAVDALDFEVETGELFGIVGPDGAGKTTTLRMLAGVLRPTSGDARVLGESVAKDREAIKKHIAYMPQRFGLYEELTVAENLAFYADLYGVPTAEREPRLERLYRFSGLAPFTGRRAGALSGGMKQKLSLSCALIHDPTLLLLDEPTFGVDPVSRRELWRILHERVAAGMTVVVSTSYLDEAERCDRVVLLAEGRSVALDRPESLLERLPGRMLELRVSDPRALRARLRGDARVLGVTLFGDTLHLRTADEESWEAVRSELESDEIEILEAHPVPPTLEDVFIELTGGREAAA